MLHKSINTLIIICLLLTHSMVWATECKLTQEYFEAWKIAYTKSKEVHKPVKSCTKSVRMANYWRAYAGCIAEGAGINVGGGCAHIVGNGSYPHPRVKPDTSHCKILVVPSALEKEYLNDLVAEINILKCQSEYPLDHVEAIESKKLNARIREHHNSAQRQT